MFYKHGGLIEPFPASSNPFPDLSRQDASNIPVLLLSGERTLEEHKIIDGELGDSCPVPSVSS
jgi:hypothetical protein